jgi:hypothetical protein
MDWDQLDDLLGIRPGLFDAFEDAARIAHPNWIVTKDGWWDFVGKSDDPCAFSSFTLVDWFLETHPQDALRIIDRVASMEGKAIAANDGVQ